MAYNPKIHHRKSIRLKGYDYAQEGSYFITICCAGRRHLFGHIENGVMVHNIYGDIAREGIELIPERYTRLTIDEFQIMPNHLHFIVTLGENCPLIALGEVIGSFKSLVHQECLNHAKEQIPEQYLGKFWQVNYYEHIIRNERSYNHIANYIIENPQNWKNDTFFC
ncbi:MAG: hypothetical protein RLZZ292_91 [Bacteroidota bacterium]|jgi:REP element-mobilizing transposase RayT